MFTQRIQILVCFDFTYGVKTMQVLEYKLRQTILSMILILTPVTGVAYSNSINWLLPSKPGIHLDFSMEVGRCSQKQLLQDIHISCKT